MAPEERCVEGGEIGRSVNVLSARWVALRSSPVPRFGTGLLGFTRLWLWEWAAQPS